MALAVLEHWFLVLPISADRLWRWSLASDKAKKGKVDSLGIMKSGDVPADQNYPYVNYANRFVPVSSNDRVL